MENSGLITYGSNSWEASTIIHELAHQVIFIFCIFYNIFKYDVPYSGLATLQQQIGGRRCG
jgi:hypothetical protein